MVQLSDIRESNTSLKSGGSGLVAVTVGSSNGIGNSFVKQLTINTDSPKIYLVGRSQKSLDDLKTELSSLNPSGTYVPVCTGDLTLLRNVDAATKRIQNSGERVDILFMSIGFLSNGIKETDEGIDELNSIRYFARMRFLYNLLPLLEAAPSPRVVSVLAAGQEGRIFPDDLSLKDPKNYSLVNSGNWSSTSTTLFFEALKKRHPNISFVHMFPGLVPTNLFAGERLNPYLSFFLRWILMPVLGPFIAYSVEEVGQRALFATTNGRFRALKPGASAEGTGMAIGSSGQKGSGVYTINEKTDAVHNDKVLQPYREQDMPDKIYANTLQEFDRALSKVPADVRNE